MTQVYLSKQFPGDIRIVVSRIFGTLAFALVAASATAKPLSAVPVHDRPTWQVVTGSPDNPGTGVPVYALESDQVIGSIPVDARFLSFGNNGKIVTFAVNGQLAYVSAASVSRLYPVVQKPDSAPRGRYSLDELAQQYDDRVKGNAAVSLDYKDSLANKSKDKEKALTALTGGNAGLGLNTLGAADYSMQPGATMINGGIPALGAMANPYGTMQGGGVERK